MNNTVDPRSWTGLNQACHQAPNLGDDEGDREAHRQG
jgi:hypothetical protein